MNDFQTMIARLIAAGLTQEQIADYVGVGQTAISKLALGKRKDMMHSNAVRLKELVERSCPATKAA